MSASCSGVRSVGAKRNPNVGMLSPGIRWRPRLANQQLSDGIIQNTSRDGVNAPFSKRSSLCASVALAVSGRNLLADGSRGDSPALTGPVRKGPGVTAEWGEHPILRLSPLG
jgi:hypothetical protein